MIVDMTLDGQHLIKIAPNEYRTEYDMFAKIILVQDVNFGDYFLVYTKDGQILEYGNTENSRQVYDGNNSDNVPLAWHLSKSSDRMGNKIDYIYMRDQLSGELQPAKIYYTGFGNQRGNTQIQFHYSSIDPKLRHTFYLEKNSDKYLNSNSFRLDKISISTSDEIEEPIRDYLISYYVGKGVLKNFFVKDITQINYKDGYPFALPPTSFGWDFYNPEYSWAGASTDEYIKTNSKIASVGLDLEGNHANYIAVYKSQIDDPVNWNNSKNIVSVYVLTIR